MKAEELQEIIIKKGIMWRGVMIILILDYINNAEMSVSETEELLNSVRFKEISTIKILRMIREKRYKREQDKVERCTFCKGKHRIRVYNFLADFPKNFEKKSLLKVPVVNYTVEIDCPKCGDKSIWERYNNKLQEQDEIEQEIAKVYLEREREND